ncbi:MAG: class I SAM-dependent methyltransferase [Streptosporangiaceae bacterium]
MTGAAAFVRAHTELRAPALVPEILLYTASEITPIWHATEAWLSARNIAPPFLAFAWPGGQAAARHILDHPELVAGRRVLDFAAGSGIAAIAAVRAGAAWVEAADIDPLACAAIRLNASANTVALSVDASDLIGSPARWDLILCGDACYEAVAAGRIMPWLRNLAGSAEVWIADPGRAYLPKLGLARFATYTVPTSLELEDRLEREVGLFRVLPA